MDSLALDFETFYGDGYTLSTMTTEEYVRDPRFEAILCSFIINDEKPYWVPRDEIPYALREAKVEKRAVIAHHVHFDGLVLNHHYGVVPKLWICTLGMGRALHGQHGRLSLEKLAERYGLPAKGKEVLNARNMRFADFGPAQLAKYGDYSCHDSWLAKTLAQHMVPQFSREELMIHDRVVRMFTEPRLVLDVEMLDRYQQMLRAEKVTLLLQAGVQQADLMSNDKFAECLRELGVEPPLKVSPTWMKKTDAERAHAQAEGKNGITYAFAKTDSGMQQLQEHPDERVQILTEARLKNKTTIAEKGAQRLIGMAGRGRATVYLKYSGASGTHRLSGGDKFNWQSMKRGSDLRNATMAENGEVCVVADSSTIEARLLDWLSGQEDMVMVYKHADAKTGPDMYCTIAERIYKRPITKEADPDERQMGKVAKLGLGFGMGADRFVFAVRGQAKVKERDANGNLVLDKFGKPVEKPLKISIQFAQQVVDIYRDAHPQVKKLWKRGESALEAIAARNHGMPVDYRGIVRTCEDGLVFPGGLRILYPDLKRIVVGQRTLSDGRTIPNYEWEFWNGKMRERIYGAKVVENIIQCLARIAVFHQSLETAKEVEPLGARWVHSQHDEAVFTSPIFEAPYVRDRLMAQFRTSPAWAPTLPLNCEAGFHQRYGKAKS